MTSSVLVDDAFQEFKYHTLPKNVNTYIFNDQENLTSRKVQISRFPELKSDLHQLMDILVKIQNIDVDVTLYDSIIILS